MEYITTEDIESLKEFEKSDLGLKILSDNRVIFESNQKGITPAVNFLKKFGTDLKNLVIYDRIVGQAVALLFVYLCEESPLKDRNVKKVLGVTGSEKAEKVLKKYQIPFYFLKTVPYIANREKTTPCPFEKLSEGKTPEEFYQIVSTRF